MKKHLSFLVVIAYILTVQTSTATDIYVAYGDSITRGYPKYTVNHSGARLGAYVPELEAKLASRGCPGHIHNWGRGGTTSTQGRIWLDDTLDLEPAAKYLLLMYGANDYFNGISANTTKSNLDSIIHKSVSAPYYVSVYLSTITPNTKALGFNAPLVTSYNPKIRALAIEQNVPLVDNYPVMCGGTGNSCSDWPAYTTDGLHIGDLGYTVMTDVWFDAIMNERGCAVLAPIYLLLLND